jgi:hypothetical protein
MDLDSLTATVLEPVADPVTLILAHAPIPAATLTFDPIATFTVPMDAAPLTLYSVPLAGFLKTRVGPGLLLLATLSPAQTPGSIIVQVTGALYPYAGPVLLPTA